MSCPRCERPSLDPAFTGHPLCSSCYDRDEATRIRAQSQSRTPPCYRCSVEPGKASIHGWLCEACWMVVRERKVVESVVSSGKLFSG